MSITKTILQGDALQVFIDQAFQLLNEDEDNNPRVISESERQAAVAELMQQYQFAPDSVDKLHGLWRLWLNVEQPKQAFHLLNQYREPLLQALEPSERAAARILLALCEIDCLVDLGETRALQALLRQTAKQLAAQPVGVYTHDRWYEWNDSAMRGECFDVVEWALDCGYPAYGAAQHVWDYLAGNHPVIKPFLSAQAKADLAHKRGDRAATAQHLTAATAAMREASQKQPIDWGQWQSLAEFALEACPPQVESILQVALAICREQDDPPSAPLERCREVSAARVRARLCHQQGDLNGALRWSERGFFGLLNDFDDYADLFCFRLNLLRQAENWQALSEFILHCLLQSESWHHSGIGGQIWSLAQRLCADSELCGEVRMRAAVIIAYCYSDKTLRKALREDAIDMPKDEGEQQRQARHWLALAREYCSAHPLADLIQGWLYSKQKKPAWGKALPLLEQSLPQLPQYATNDFLGALWMARFKCLKAEQALERPFVPSLDGYWCAQFADDLKQHFSHLAPKHLPSLIQRYLEEAVKQFERFWQSGEGSFSSSNLSWYTDACCQLAGHYRAQQRYFEARQLYQRAIASRDEEGMQVGPWRELLDCVIDEGDDLAIVEVAENLWHCSTAEGDYVNDSYFCHYPGDYCASVCMALHRLERDLEISIWLDRLSQWFSQQQPTSPELRAGVKRAYENHSLDVLEILGIRHAALALEYLHARFEAIEALGDKDIWQKAQELRQSLEATAQARGAA